MLVIVAVLAAVMIALVILFSVAKYNLYFMFAVGRIRFNLEKITIGPKEKAEKPELELAHENCKKWLECQNYEEVEIVSKDGLRLRAHYLPAEQAERTILLFHGWRGSWNQDFADQAKVFHENRTNLLLVEQRAHGRSEGKYIGFGVLERNDCARWVSFIQEKEQEKFPVYLMGVSMGATTVLMAAGKNFSMKINGIIADCGFTSPYDMICLAAEKMLHIRKYSVIDKVNSICRKKASYDLKGYSVKEAMQKCKVPVFFVHGTADHFVPMQMGIANYNACTARKKLFLVEGADHCKSFLHNTKEYMRQLNLFFQWDMQLESNS